MKKTKGPDAPKANTIVLHEVFDPTQDHNRFQLLEDLTIVNGIDNRPITISAGHIIDVLQFVHTEFRIRRETGFTDICFTVRDPYLTIVGRQIFSLTRDDEARKQKEALQVVQHWLALSRRDLLFAMACFIPGGGEKDPDHFQYLYGLTKDRGSDWDSENPVSHEDLEIKAKRIFHKKFGKKASNATFDTTVDGIPIQVSIVFNSPLQSPSDYWEAENYKPIGFKISYEDKKNDFRMAMEWRPYKTNGVFRPLIPMSGSDHYSTDQFLALFEKKTQDQLFYYLMEKL